MFVPSKKANMAALIARLEGMRDKQAGQGPRGWNPPAHQRPQEQKSKDMNDMALAAAKAGRKATCKSYIAQKNTHDSAVAQYAGLISTLVQQQTVQDISTVHREIANALKHQKEADYSSQIDNAADWADSVERHQQEFGSIGGAMFQTGDDDVDAQVAAMMAEVAIDPPAPAAGLAAAREDSVQDLPPVPTDPPSTAPFDEGSLPPVFSALLEKQASRDGPPRTQPAPAKTSSTRAEFTFNL